MSSPADQIAARVATHLRDDDVVNLGIGIPTLVADHIADRPGVVLQTENGMLGVGSTPASFRSASCPAPPTSPARSRSR